MNISLLEHGLVISSVIEACRCPVHDPYACSAWYIRRINGHEFQSDLKGSLLSGHIASNPHPAHIDGQTTPVGAPVCTLNRDDILRGYVCECRS